MEKKYLKKSKNPKNPNRKIKQIPKKRECFEYSKIQKINLNEIILENSKFLIIKNN